MADQNALCTQYRNAHKELLRRYNALLNDLSGRVQQNYPTEQVAQARREQGLGEQLIIKFSKDLVFMFFDNIVQGSQVINMEFSQWDTVHSAMKT